MTADDLRQASLPTSGYGYSATRLDDLGAAEYTLVSIVCDVSGSIGAFQDELERAARAARSLDLRLDCLDATLLTITAVGGALAACCHGDGVVALGRQDGWIKVYAVSYVASYHGYPSYRLDASRRDQWETQPGNEKRVTRWIENAPQLFEGAALQSLLGAWYASLLTGPGRCHQVRLAELDSAQVLDAKFQGGVLMVTVARTGRCEKLIFCFDSDYGSYRCPRRPRHRRDGANFVVLAHGVYLHLNDRDELEVFPARMGVEGLKVIADPALAGDCLLLRDGPRALVARGGALSGFAMR